KTQKFFGNRRVDQDSPQNGTQNNRQDGESFDPAVALDELVGRQHLGDNSILCRGVGGSSDANQCVGGKHQYQLTLYVQSKQLMTAHQQAPCDLYSIGHEQSQSLG